MTAQYATQGNLKNNLKEGQQIHFIKNTLEYKSQMTKFIAHCICIERKLKSKEDQSVCSQKVLDLDV